MQPQTCYYVALAAIVLPSLAFNRLAAVIAGVWVIGVGVTIAGLNIDGFDAFVDALAFCIAVHIAGHRRSFGAYAVALLFLPMVANDVAAATGWAHPYYTWWLRFWLAMLQVALLPFDFDYRRIWLTMVLLDARLMQWLANHFARLVRAVR